MEQSKLVLYSQQSTPGTKVIDLYLVRMLKKPSPRIAYIPSGNDPTGEYYQNQRAYYDQYQVELSPCFEFNSKSNTNQLETLFSADAIHLSGGNTLQFLQRLRAHGLITPLIQYVKDGGLLIGVSAGAILMTPDIRTTFVCGDIQPSEPIDTQGMGLVDFAFVPHLGSHADIEEIIKYSKQNHDLVVYACSDIGGIVIEDDQVKGFGEIYRIKNGSIVDN